MKYTTLGRSGLQVSDICLGTMTWGIQNNQQEADAQLGAAVNAGINFIDTAEMYPIPPNEPTSGDTERILGNWLSRHHTKREELVVMSKIAGSGIQWIREGEGINSKTIPTALNSSLQRLQTDYLDVYQLHWPNRTSPHFGKHWPGKTDPSAINAEQERDGMREILLALKAAMDEGKIRHWGLSDDTPWGIHTFLSLCKELNVPAPVCIQNEFSLLHAKDWPYLIEMCHLENIAYLPWSPLATGMLSGKYAGGERPKNSRWTYVQRQGLFRDKPQAHDATKRYMEIAGRAGITSSQLALAWCKQVPGITSTIIGATSIKQLEENISAFDITLDEAILRQIDEVLRQYPLGF